MLKIHTKRSIHRHDGDHWRDDLFNKLLGSPKLVGKIKEKLDSQPDVGIIAPHGHILSSASYWGANENNIKRLANLADISYDGKEFPFVAGSMFWFRPSALTPLTSLGLTTDDFEIEKGQVDGTLAHAMERFFGLVTKATGLSIIGLEKNNLKKIIKFHPIPKNPVTSPVLRPEFAGSISQYPIIVYQMGKVGSTTVEVSLRETFQKLSLNLFIHRLHVLNNLEEEEKKIRLDSIVVKGDLRHIKKVKALRRTMEANPAQYWNLISLVRDPVARNVGVFFHHLHKYLPRGFNLYVDGKPNLENLLECFLEPLPFHKEPGIWFETQMKPVFGIDAFASPFPKEDGYKIYHDSPRTPLLIIRLENLNQCAEQAMRDFLGLENFQLINANIGEEKEYADVYRAFKEKVRLPLEYINEIYSSKVARHFYTDAELDAFRAKWTRAGQ